MAAYPAAPYVANHLRLPEGCSGAPRPGEMLVPLVLHPADGTAWLRSKSGNVRLVADPPDVEQQAIHVLSRGPRVDVLLFHELHCREGALDADGRLLPNAWHLEPLRCRRMAPSRFQVLHVVPAPPDAAPLAAVLEQLREDSVVDLREARNRADMYRTVALVLRGLVGGRGLTDGAPVADQDAGPPADAVLQPGRVLQE